MNEVVFEGIPIFRILDVEKAIDFYIKYLDFDIDWEYRFSKSEPVYMQISRNGLVIHLSENKRFKTGNVLLVQTKGIEIFLQGLSVKDYGTQKPAASLSQWNSKIMEIEDPFGNLIRFNEDLPNTMN